jgi:hypothetical protein
MQSSLLSVSFKLTLHLIVLCITLMHSHAHALGGEGIAEGILKLSALLIAWLAASTTTLFWKTKWFSTAWLLVWTLRLSLPMYVAWELLVTPKLYQAESARNEVRKSTIQKDFSELCAAHLPKATQALQVNTAARPTRFFVDNTGMMTANNPSVADLYVCMPDAAPTACAGVRFDALEWVWNHSQGFGPCKVGLDPSRPGQCLPEFNRTERGMNAQAINRPEAHHKIRVGFAERPTYEPQEVRKIVVSLERADDQTVLATTTMLEGAWSPMCPPFVEAVAATIKAGFPNP